MKTKNIALLLFVCPLLGGCFGLVDMHRPVPDWPALKIVEYHVSEAEMRDQCARYMPPLVSPSACTLFYFDRQEAHIYVSKDFPSAQILAHERLHAAGYDHVGSRAMTRLWQNWRAKAGD